MVYDYVENMGGGYDCIENVGGGYDYIENMGGMITLKIWGYPFMMIFMGEEGKKEKIKCVCVGGGGGG